MQLLKFGAARLGFLASLRFPLTTESVAGDARS